LIADIHISPSLGVKSAALTGGRSLPGYPDYHVFNLSELATPNFYWNAGVKCGQYPFCTWGQTG